MVAHERRSVQVLRPSGSTDHRGPADLPTLVVLPVEAPVPVTGLRPMAQPPGRARRPRPKVAIIRAGSILAQTADELAKKHIGNVHKGNMRCVRCRTVWPCDIRARAEEVLTLTEN